MLGSPVGLFLSVYFEEGAAREKLPTCRHYYNLYHPQDVVAYRIEPLLPWGSPAKEMPPVLLPYYKTGGYRGLSFFFKKPTMEEMQSQIKELQKEFDSKDPPCEEEKTDAPERYDFCLQTRGMESIFKPIGLLMSHLRYFKSKDVAYFVLKKLHKQKDMNYDLPIQS